MLVDENPKLREGIDSGELLFGTTDTFLIWRLTGGSVPSPSLSSICPYCLIYSCHAGRYMQRTTRMQGPQRSSTLSISRFLLFHRIFDDVLAVLIRIGMVQWSNDVMAMLTGGYFPPLQRLPELRQSSGDFGKTLSSLLGLEIPIRGQLVHFETLVIDFCLILDCDIAVIGDQSSAAFGNGCSKAGDTKISLGSRSTALIQVGFLLINRYFRNDRNYGNADGDQGSRTDCPRGVSSDCMEAQRRGALSSL